jgi:hypothetical protein
MGISMMTINSSTQCTLSNVIIKPNMNVRVFQTASNATSFVLIFALQKHQFFKHFIRHSGSVRSHDAAALEEYALYRR